MILYLRPKIARNAREAQQRIRTRNCRSSPFRVVYPRDCRPVNLDGFLKGARLKAPLNFSFSVSFQVGIGFAEMGVAQKASIC